MIRYLNIEILHINVRNLMLKSKNAQVLFGLNNNILLVLFVV
jgi:hypothetical protein